MWSLLSNHFRVGNKILTKSVDHKIAFWGQKPSCHLELLLKFLISGHSCTTDSYTPTVCMVNLSMMPVAWKDFRNAITIFWPKRYFNQDVFLSKY